MFADPVLKRFSIRVLKSDGSGAQVPAVGATIEFYKQGATVKAGITLENNHVTPVQVYNTGALVQDDLVQLNTSGTTLTVDAVYPDSATVDLTNSTGDYVVLETNDRLVRIESEEPDPALIYNNPVAAGTGLPSATTDEDGWAEGYVNDYRVDYIVSGDGLTDRLFADDVGSYVFQ